MDDMPWAIGLTDEEIQELRNKKYELSQYGKEKIRKLMTKLTYEEWKNSKYSIPDIVLETIEDEEEIEKLLQRHYEYYLNDKDT